MDSSDLGDLLWALTCRSAFQQSLGSPDARTGQSVGVRVSNTLNIYENSRVNSPGLVRIRSGVHFGQLASVYGGNVARTS